jgi:PAS domain S-box-containing protein
MTRKRFLSLVLLISIIAVLFFPFYTKLYLYPAFTNHLLRDAENSAGQMANHIVHYLPYPENDLQQNDITSDVIAEVYELILDFGVEKVKIFSPTGEIIYSTTPEDIGTINTRNYFRTVIDQGINFTKIVQKDTESAEGRILKVDVVETYVPIKFEDKIIGACEVYYDITEHKKMIDSLVRSSSITVYAVTLILLAALLITLFRLNKDMLAREKAEKELAKHLDHLEAMVGARTAELRLVNKQLRDDIEKRQKAEKALKESEQKYRGLIETASDAIFVIDVDSGTIIDVNKKGVELIGRSAEELIGLHLSQLHPSDETEKYIGLFKTFASQLTSADVEYHVLNKAGYRVPVEISTSVMELEGKKIIQGIFRDISERLKLEDEIQKAQRLESAGVLAGGIAHDFNNLLTAVLGNISLAKIYAEPEGNVSVRLSESEKAIQRAKNLTLQLLTFAKGGVPITINVDLSDTIRESTEFVLRGTKLRCICEIPRKLWPVEADPGQINQVLHNLIINAYQVMPDGGECRVVAKNVAVDKADSIPLPAGKYIQISVHDKGPGIPKEHLPRIFDPFFTTKAAGSGLGLSTSYAIIKKHGGLLTVDTEMGTGTSFHVYLPASVKSLSTETDNKEGEGVIKGEGWVLLMDDEEFIREIANELLSHLGYEVDLAVDGKEAIDLYRKSMESGKPYDVVIMDLTIPGGMGGMETIVELKKIDPDVKAIVSSGYANDPILADYKKYGFMGMVPKPYKIEELSKALYASIDRTS